MLTPVLTAISRKAGWQLLGALVLGCAAFALAMRTPFCQTALKLLHARATAFLRAHGR